MAILVVLGTEGIIFEVPGPTGDTFRGPVSAGDQFRGPGTHMAPFQGMIDANPVTVSSRIPVTQKPPTIVAFFCSGQFEVRRPEVTILEVLGTTGGLGQALPMLGTKIESF